MLRCKMMQSTKEVCPMIAITVVFLAVVFTLTLMITFDSNT